MFTSVYLFQNIIVDIIIVDKYYSGICKRVKIILNE